MRPQPERPERQGYEPSGEIASTAGELASLEPFLNAAMDALHLPYLFRRDSLARWDRAAFGLSRFELLVG